MLLLLALACDPKPADVPDDGEVPFLIDEVPLTPFVDPMVGTRGPGNTIPGALVPHGMVRASPHTVGDPGRVEAYEHDATRIEGFTHTQLEGPGGGSYGYSEVLLQPFTGTIDLTPGGLSQAFSHDTEQASPGRYAVTLEDDGIGVELTATAHAALHRYTFPGGEAGRVALDLGRTLGLPGRGEVAVVDDRTLEGHTDLVVHPVVHLFTGEDEPTGETTVYVHVRFSRPFEGFGVFAGSSPERVARPDEDAIEGDRPGAWVELPAGDPVLVRVGISYISVDQARANATREIGDRGFEEVQAEAVAAWDHVLNRIQVEGEPTRVGRFYTALYRSAMQPADYTEDGRFHMAADGQSKVLEATWGRYLTDDWCMWDTFRTSHPLATLIEPEWEEDGISSMLATYQDGGWLPKCTWHASGYSRVMIANPATIIIADAAVKGITGFDTDLAWEAVDHAGTEDIPLTDGICGYIDLGTPPDYLELGYVPTECDPTQSVSMTLEYAQDDFATAQLATVLGRQADADRYLARSASFQHHWNPDHGFMQAKRRSGEWVEPFDPTDDSDSNDFCEADSWIYSFFVPHDVPWLIDAMGGPEAFVARLDAFFDEGHFDPSNQPSFHIPWLYADAGQPWRTQARVRDILETRFGSGPDGLPGNDDAGSMSAWYVLGALGLYPVNPSDPTYHLATPLFERVTLHLHPGWYDGGSFVIETSADPLANPYIQSATLNGAPLDRAWITHAEIVAGGTLHLEVGPAPSDWGG